MISKRQLEIAFGKFATGHRPGEESWCDYDQEALDYVLGGASIKYINDLELLVSKIEDLIDENMTWTSGASTVSWKIAELFKSYH